MAATGRGSLRPYQPNKARNFFVAGLLFVVMVLSYNYWIASATKNQLAYDISSLQVSLQKLRLADSQLKECQRDVAHMEAEMNVTVQKNEKYLSDLRREVSDLRSRNDDLSQNLDSRQQAVVAKNIEIDKIKRETADSCSTRLQKAMEMEEEKCGAEKRNLSGKMRELERTFGAEKQNANEEVNRLKQRLSQLESELQHEKQKVTDKQFVVNRLQQQLEQLRQQQTKRLMQRLDKQAVPSSLMSHGLPLKSGLSFQNVSGGLGRNDHETPREAAQSVSRQKILADASFNGRAPALVPQNQRSPFQHLSGSNVTTSGQQSVARLGPNREELPQQSPPDSDQRLESNPDHQPDLPKLGSNFTTYGGRRLQHRRLYRNQSDSGGISRWRELPPSVQAAVNSSSMPDSNSSLPSDELRLMTVLPTVVDDRAPSGMNYRKKGSPSVGDVGHQDLGVQPTSSSVAVNRTVDQALQVPNSRTQVNGGHLEAGPLALTNVGQERNSEVLLNSTSQYNRSDTKNASNVTVVGMDFNVTENDQGRLYATYGISKNSGFGMVLNQSHTEETRPSDPNRMRSDSGGKPPTGSLLGEVLPELNTTVPPNQSTVGTNGSYDGVKAFVSENERTSENAPSREPRPIALAPPLGDVTASKDNASAELKVGKLGDGAVIKFGNASAANSWSPADTISSGSRNGTTVNVSGDDSRSQVLLQTAPMGIGVASTNQMRVTDRRRDQATFDVGNRHEAKQNETDVSESGVALEKESRRDGGPEHRGAEHERQWISSVNGDERQSQLRSQRGGRIAEAGRLAVPDEAGFIRQR